LKCTYTTSCKLTKLCKCWVKIFKVLRVGSGLWFVAILAKLSIAPSLGASLDHHQSLNLELPHCHLNYLTSEQDNKLPTLLIFFPFCYRKRQEDEGREDPCRVLLPTSSPCAILFLGIVLCRLQECEAKHIGLIFTSRGEHDLPLAPCPWFFHFCVCISWVMFVLTSPLPLEGGEQDLPHPPCLQGFFVSMLAF
jgi:hypothetical protein